MDLANFVEQKTKDFFETNCKEINSRRRNCKKESSPIVEMNVGHGADPGFLAVSPQVTLVINPVVYTRCRYFPPGQRLLSQPKRSPNYTASSQ